MKKLYTFALMIIYSSCLFFNSFGVKKAIIIMPIIDNELIENEQINEQPFQDHFRSLIESLGLNEQNQESLDSSDIFEILASRARNDQELSQNWQSEDEDEADFIDEHDLNDNQDIAPSFREINEAQNNLLDMLKAKFLSIKDRMPNLQSQELSNLQQLHDSEPNFINQYNNLLELLKKQSLIAENSNKPDNPVDQAPSYRLLTFINDLIEKLQQSPDKYEDSGLSDNANPVDDIKENLVLKPNNEVELNKKN